MSSLGLLSLVAGGGLLMARLEGWPPSRGVYWALLAATTTGSAAEAPSTTLGLAVAVPLSIASAIILVYPLAAVSNALFG